TSHFRKRAGIRRLLFNPPGSKDKGRMAIFTLTSGLTVLQDFPIHSYFTTRLFSTCRESRKAKPPQHPRLPMLITFALIPLPWLMRLISVSRHFKTRRLPIRKTAESKLPWVQCVQPGTNSCGVPGRKSVLWVTAGFPLPPDPGRPHYLRQRIGRITFHHQPTQL